MRQRWLSRPDLLQGEGRGRRPETELREPDLTRREPCWGRPKGRAGGSPPRWTLQTGGSRPSHGARPMAVGVLISRPQRNGRRGPADPRPAGARRESVWHLRRFLQLALDSGGRQDSLSAPPPLAPPQHTHSKASPSDMAPEGGLHGASAPSLTGQPQACRGLPCLASRLQPRRVETRAPALSAAPAPARRGRAVSPGRAGLPVCPARVGAHDTQGGLRSRWAPGLGPPGREPEGWQPRPRRRQGPALRPSRARPPTGAAGSPSLAAGQDRAGAHPDADPASPSRGRPAPPPVIPPPSTGSRPGPGRLTDPGPGAVPPLPTPPLARKFASRGGSSGT